MSTVPTGDVPSLEGSGEDLNPRDMGFVVGYTLDENGEPKPTRDMIEHSMWCYGPGGDKRRRVDATELHLLRVSTVFLGLDHNHWGEGPPILWETMVFGWKYDCEQYRYSSRAAAELGHKMTVEMVLSKHGRKSRSHKLKVLWKRYRRQTKG